MFFFTENCTHLKNNMDDNINDDNESIDYGNGIGSISETEYASGK